MSSSPPVPPGSKYQDIVQGVFGSKRIHRAMKEKFSEMNFKPEDESKLRLDNLDALNEAELLYFETKYIKDNLPTWRLWMTAAYHIPMTFLSYYYMKNFPKIKRRWFPSYQTKKGIGSMVKLGTYHAFAFSIIYFSGLALASGVYHPIKYLKGMFAIQGKLADLNLRFDSVAQEMFLFTSCRFFGLKEETIQIIKKELDDKKEELEKQNFFIVSSRELQELEDGL